MYRLKNALWVSLACALVAGVAGAGELSPEQTLTKYLGALKDGNFRAAYHYITKGMAQNKPEEQWAKEMQFMTQMTEAKIFSYHVYPGKKVGAKAFVPNVLSSQDKYLNQLGVEEHELYTLIREAGAWKVDQQQLVERVNLSKWFPPEVSGAASP